MNRILFILLFVLAAGLLPAQDKPVLLRTIIEGNDTLPVAELRGIYVFPPLDFKNKRQYRRYNKLVRNVKKVYPYARLAGIKLREYEDTLSSVQTKKERRQIMKMAEDEIQNEFGEELKKLTFSQGKILIKLIDRETGTSSFALVQELRGKFIAFFWQSFARIFGYNLKVRYDPEGEDAAIERIVCLIENGQL